MTDFVRSHRRDFLLDTTRGLGGVALGAMLADDGITRAAPTTSVPDGLAHIAPQAKSVIWMFMVGGASHMETFDPKPALNKYAGISIDKTPFAETLKNPFVDENVRVVVPDDANGHVWPKVYPLQVGYRKRGESGIEVSDWWPHLGECIDDLAVVRSMWTTDNNHGAQLQFHTGRHSLDGFFPTVGSWIHYGLGSLNDNLPQFIVMGTPIADCCGGQGAHGANYLGPEHNGVQLEVNPARPLPFATPGGALYREEQRGQFELLDRLNQLTAAEHPDDAALRARIKSYQLAYRMQMTVPEVMEFSSETKSTRSKYGIDNSTTRTFGQQCLAARRMVERGVRFVQIFHGSNGGAGRWDGHSNLRTGHARVCLDGDAATGPGCQTAGDSRSQATRDRLRASHRCGDRLETLPADHLLPNRPTLVGSTSGRHRGHVAGSDRADGHLHTPQPAARDCGGLRYRNRLGSAPAGPWTPGPGSCRCVGTGLAPLA